MPLYRVIGSDPERTQEFSEDQFEALGLSEEYEFVALTTAERDRIELLDRIKNKVEVDDGDPGQPALPLGDDDPAKVESSTPTSTTRKGTDVTSAPRTKGV